MYFLQLPPVSEDGWQPIPPDEPPSKEAIAAHNAQLDALAQDWEDAISEIDQNPKTPEPPQNNHNQVQHPILPPDANNNLPHKERSYERGTAFVLPAWITRKPQDDP